MSFWAVDAKPGVGSSDGVVDAPTEQGVHPACMEGLQFHRIVAVGRELGQSFDEARRSLEVATMSVEDGKPEVDRKLFGVRGTGHHQLGGARVGTLYLGCAQPA